MPAKPLNKEIIGKSGIYVITNNKKEEKNQYVGMSNNIQRRWHEHRDLALHPRKQDDYDKVLYKAMRKYGLEYFSIKVLEEIDKNDIEKMKEQECYWIDKLDTYHNGYNETLGGDVIGDKGIHYGESHPRHLFTEEEVKKCRKWYKEGKNSMDIYHTYFPNYKVNTFLNMWHGRNWKQIMPEVFENNPHPKKKVTKELVEEIRAYHTKNPEQSLNSIF